MELRIARRALLFGFGAGLMHCAQRKGGCGSGCGEKGGAENTGGTASAVVTVRSEGSSAEQLELDAVIPIESAVGGLEGARGTRATIRTGLASIEVECESYIEIESLLESVRAAVEGLRSRLPGDVQLEFSRTWDAPAAIWLSLAGPGSAVSASELARSSLRPALESLFGVSMVRLVGEVTRVHIVRVDTKKAAALGISMTRIDMALHDVVVPDTLEGLLTMPIQGQTRLEDIATIEAGTIPAEPARAAEPSRPLMLGVYTQVGVDPQRVAPDIREAVAGIRNTLPGGWVLAESAPPAEDGQKGVCAVTVSGAEHDKLSSLASAVERALLERSGLVSNLHRDDHDVSPESSVVADRNQVAQLGVSMSDLGMTLRALVGGIRCGPLPGIPREHPPVPVMLHAEPRNGSLTERLAGAYVPAQNGSAVPLAMVTRVDERQQVVIHRRDGVRVITISFDPAPSHACSDAREAIAEATRERPDGYQVAEKF